MAGIADVSEILQNHNGNYCTLNRLWLKHHKSAGWRKMWPDRYTDTMVLAAPELNKGNITITTERRTTADLYDLAGSTPRPLPPEKDNTPVVIVRFRSNDYLIDGGKRCTKWHQENNQDMHDAYIVTVIEN